MPAIGTFAIDTKSITAQLGEILKSGLFEPLGALIKSTIESASENKEKEIEFDLDSTRALIADNATLLLPVLRPDLLADASKPGAKIYVISGGYPGAYKVCVMYGYDAVPAKAKFLESKMGATVPEAFKEMLTLTSKLMMVHVLSSSSPAYVLPGKPSPTTGGCFFQAPPKPTEEEILHHHCWGKPIKLELSPDDLAGLDNKAKFGIFADARDNGKHGANAISNSAPKYHYPQRTGYDWDNAKPLYDIPEPYIEFQRQDSANPEPVRIKTSFNGGEADFNPGPSFGGGYKFNIAQPSLPVRYASATERANGGGIRRPSTPHH